MQQLELKPQHSNMMIEYILLYKAIGYTTDDNVYNAIQARLKYIAIEFCFSEYDSHLEVCNFCKRVLKRFNISIEL